MASKARLETVITGDDSPFVAAVNRAEKRAQSFHSRLTGLFRKTPDARAERALSGFVGSLAGGDIQGAVVGITERMRGLGLVAGVTIGAAVVVFEKFRKEIEASQKASAALNKELARPVSLQASLGAEGIEKEIDRLDEKLKDFNEKRRAVGNKVANVVTGHTSGLLPGLLLPFQTRKPAEQEAKQAAQAEERLKLLASQRADSELTVARQKQIAVNSSEREAALLKTQLDYQKRVAEISLESSLTKPGRSAETLFKRLAAAKIEHEAAVDPIVKRFDLKEKEEAVQNRILDSQTKGLTKDEQSLAALRERINLLKQRIAGPGTKEEKAGLKTELHGLQNEEYREKYKNRFDGPALYTPEKGEAAKFAAFVKSQKPSTPDAYIRNPAAYDRSPDAYDVAPQTGREYQSQLGNLNRHMADPGHMPGPTHMGAKGGPDTKQAGGTELGSPGVLDRIEGKLDGIGVNR